MLIHLLCVAYKRFLFTARLAFVFKPQTDSNIVLSFFFCYKMRQTVYHVFSNHSPHTILPTMRSCRFRVCMYVSFFHKTPWKFRISPTCSINSLRTLLFSYDDGLPLQASSYSLSLFALLFLTRFVIKSVVSVVIFRSSCFRI